MSNQTVEGDAFIQRIQHRIPLDDALQPSLEDEAALRRLFATDPSNERLQNPYVGLVDVFNAPDPIFRTRARVVNGPDELDANYVMPLSSDKRRDDGALCMVPDLESFRKNWSIFSEGSLSQLSEWDNVVVAGGSVLACLTPLPESATISKRAVRKFYHTNAYPTSDVDVFLWGLTPEQAEAKIVKIYEAVRDSVPWDVTCVRTKHTVSIHSQYPYRSVQIVLRLYRSVSEILTGFDIDAPCCAYDGARVWANPRAIVAMMRQCNTVDMTRRSPSYEVRLAKYAARDFEIYVPTLRRADIDPTIFERSIARIEGLARLLVFEQIKGSNERDSFLGSRRRLRGRPGDDRRNNNYRRKLKGDLKSDTSIGGLEMNDYDVASLHIPYGPGWDARRIDKLVYQTDLGMNSTFNPKNKGRRLHRHAAFFGTIEDCLGDCCEYCPTAIDDDERALQKEEDKQYIRGRIEFIQEDPGRQSMSGSFNPIDEGEWSEQVYIGPSEKFFTAIASGDSTKVATLLDEGVDINRRDHVGRTSLHLAILCRNVDISIALIERGARISARLVDGRSPLHLAAQCNLLPVLEILLDRSAKNAKSIAKESEDTVDGTVAVAVEHPSSEDDWSSEDDGVISMEDDIDGDDEDEDEAQDEQSRETKNPDVTEQAELGALDEDDNTPDVLDVNLQEWDMGFSPLSFAVMYGSVDIVDRLLVAGAYISEPPPGSAHQKNQHPNTRHPLSNLILRDDEDEACAIARRLLQQLDSLSSIADSRIRTFFYEAVLAKRTKLVTFLLQHDPMAISVINLPSSYYGDTKVPLSAALQNADYATLAVLLAYGANLNPTCDEATLSLMKKLSQSESSRHYTDDSFENLVKPAELAMAKRDDVLTLLLALGAHYDIGIKLSTRRYAGDLYTLLDYTRFAQKEVSTTLATLKANDAARAKEPETPSTWKAYHAILVARSSVRSSRSYTLKEDRQLQKTIEYFKDAEKLLAGYGAKTWNELFPANQWTGPVPHSSYGTTENGRYLRMKVSGHSSHLLDEQYDELYEACFAGDNEKIKQLCLPDEGDENSVALSLSVQLLDPENTWSRTGWTPLYAAVCGRHWSTVHLLFAIIGAQYEPEDKEDKFKPHIVLDDDDSDNESATSHDSDDTLDQDKPYFFDVASRSSRIKSPVSQAYYLHDTSLKFPPSQSNVWGADCNLIRNFIKLNDIEGFRQTLKLYKNALGGPIPLDDAILTEIISSDRADMLDEFIRHSGLGIHFETRGQGDDDHDLFVNDRNRVYLGLNVHGKKRHDLVRRGDPNAAQEGYDDVTPLVWRAAQSRAKNLVQYLGGDGPLVAYKHYSITHNDTRAIKLRRSNLAKMLPEWLGWKVNSLGESPLTAAVLSRDLGTLKAVLSVKSPNVPKAAIHNQLKFLGSNLLLIAVQIACNMDMIDFLLSRSLDASSVDETKGWNIYHFICSSTVQYSSSPAGTNPQTIKKDNLEHLLSKLPRELNESLLCQRSKTRMNTPLHLAVQAGDVDIVKVLVKYTRSALGYQDVDGLTPLHLAVKSSYIDIVKVLLEECPDNIIHAENGVGNTALDMGAALAFQDAIKTHQTSLDKSMDTLNIHHIGYTPRINVDSLPGTLLRLKETMTSLAADGKLDAETSLAKELNTFILLMEDKLSVAKADLAMDPDADSPKAATTDVQGTFKLLRNWGYARNLVHLLDVQRSVGRNLAWSGGERDKKVYTQYDSEILAPEGDEETKERQDSMTIKVLGWKPEEYDKRYLSYY